MSYSSKIVPIRSASNIRLSEEETDETLVADARSGSLYAQEAIYRKYVRYIGAIVARLLRNQNDMEDIVQDTFIQGFSELSRLRDPRKLKSWLAGIAVHKVHRKFRKQKMRRRLFRGKASIDYPLSAQCAPGVKSEILGEIVLLDRLLNNLNENNRMCWMLKNIEEFTLEEIATATQVSVATVKRRIKQANDYIQKYTERDS